MPNQAAWVAAIRAIPRDELRDELTLLSPHFTVGDWCICAEHQRRYESVVLRPAQYSSSSTPPEPLVKDLKKCPRSDRNKGWLYRVKLTPFGLAGFVQTLTTPPQFRLTGQSERSLDRRSPEDVEVPPLAGRPQPVAAAGDVSVAEGRELLRLHRTRERNRGLVARKKRTVLAEFGRLVCEACTFDFAAAYGPRGNGFAECHHTQPISQSAPGRRTWLSELAVVCANCHRMLHRRPWVSVPELRALVQSRQGE